MMFARFKLPFLTLSLLSITAFSAPGNAVRIENTSDTITLQVLHHVARYKPGKERPEELIEHGVTLGPNAQEDVMLNPFHRNWLTDPNVPSGTQYQVTVHVFFPNHEENYGNYAQSRLISLQEALAHYTGGTVSVGIGVVPLGGFRVPTIKFDHG